MSAGKERYTYVLRSLASMPFLDRLELAAVSDVPDRTTYDAVADLERRGLVDSIPHATDLLRTTRRFYLTAAGLNRLSDEEGVSLDEMLRTYPVSVQWRRILLGRLDAVAVIYRVAAAIAAEQGAIGFRWFRREPLDATVVLHDGRTVGIVRQGATSYRTGFAKRLWRLGEGPAPSAVLALLPDAVRLRDARRRLTGTPLPALLALESDAALARADDPVWHLPSIAATLDLRYVLSYIGQGGTLPTESEFSQASLPENISMEGPERDTPDHLLPAILKPAEKRTLDILADWPWITSVDLCRLMGFSAARLSQIVMPLVGAGLVSRISTPGRRLALTERGLTMLARRDRTAVGTVRKLWSVASLDSDAPADWRNVSGSRSRQLLRNIEHTDAVHGFVTALARQSRAQGWEIVQLDPPRRASRYFRYDGRLHSVRPDSFGVVRKGAVTWPFFLEWERRAVRPTTMAARLAPYLRYFSSHQPIDDHGVQPAVLVVFDHDLTETHFLRVAREEMERARVQLPLWVSHRVALEELGPLGRAWRTPGDSGSTYAFPER